MNFLNEEKYNKSKKKIKLIALLILIVGLSCGGFLIYKGTNNSNESKIEDEKAKLEKMKTDLVEKGVTPSSDYEAGEAYDLYILREVLNPSFNRCFQNEFKTNKLTKEYCKLVDSNSSFNRSSSIGLGAFICISSCMISLFVFIMSKQRDIVAYQMQGVLPVGKEALEDIQPTASKVAKKHMHEVSPEVGEMAKEITKGIKEGLKDENGDK